MQGTDRASVDGLAQDGDRQRRGGGYTSRAIVAESQPSHQPAHVNRIVRCLPWSTAPAVTARMTSHTTAQPMPYAVYVLDWKRIGSSRVIGYSCLRIRARSGFTMEARKMGHILPLLQRNVTTSLSTASKL